MKQILIVTGQTATGKTAFAHSLAKQVNGELVNFDARQIYRDLTIVTGKDIGKAHFNLHDTFNTFQIGWYDVNDVTVWLHDIVSPMEHFSAYDFQSVCLRVITDILKRNKTPILIGGTYFYLAQLLYRDQSETNTKVNWEQRHELDKCSVSQLHEILSQEAPERLSQLNQSDRLNPHRLIRQIEKARAGEDEDSKLSYHFQLAKKLNLSEIPITIHGFRHTNTTTMREHIYNRVIQRMKDGALSEYSSLLEKGYTVTAPGLNAIGYQELAGYFTGQQSETETISRWVTREYQYARRQLIFMKRDPHIHWTNIG